MLRPEVEEKTAWVVESATENFALGHRKRRPTDFLELLRDGAGGSLLALLWQKDGVDVGQNSSGGDGHGGQELTQLLVIPDGELDVPWDDPGLLVVPGGVSGQLEDLSGEVLHDGGKVDRGTGSDPGGVLSVLQIPPDPSHWELESSLGGLGDGLLAALSLSSSGHGCLVVEFRACARRRSCF